MTRVALLAVSAVDVAVPRTEFDALFERYSIPVLSR